MNRKSLLVTLGVFAVIVGAVFLLNVKVSGPSLASAQTATQQALDTSPGILPVVSAAGHYIPMASTVAGAPIIQLANPNSSIPTNGIALANDAGGSDIVTGLKSFPVVNLDGGAGGTQGLIALSQVNANTVANCNLINPVSAGTAAGTNYGCNALTKPATGGDAGYILVTCNLANLGFDGGQASCTVVN